MNFLTGVIVSGAAVVLTILFITKAVEHNIDSERQIKIECITHGGSWIAGHCIQR